MARSIQEIEDQLLAYKAREPRLSQLDSSSKTAVWRRITFVVATAFQTLEKKWEALSVEFSELVRAAKPMTLYWYQQQALRFQYRFHYDEWGLYDNQGVSDEAIAKAKIVKYAAAYCIGRKLFIKVVTARAGVPAQLDEGQQRALKSYFEDIGSAGTLVEIVSRPPDHFKIEVEIYYDPIILDQSGARLDGSDKGPVKKAIEGYLKNLDFNGQLNLTDLSNVMEGVDGVKQVKISGAWSKYGRYTYDDSEHPNVGRIDEFRTMDAGYAVLDQAGTKIYYLPKSS